MARVFNIKLNAPLSSMTNRLGFLKMLRQSGATLAGEGKLIPWISVFSERPDRLWDLPGVIGIEEDYGCEECAPFDDGPTSLADAWPLRMIEADAAHRISRGLGSKIAIIDTGFVMHPELVGAHLGAPETFVPAEDVYDHNGHGLSTHGLVVGQGPVVYGVAPEAEVHSLKALDRHGRGRWAWIALAVERAAQLKCNVATMALGGPDGSHMLEDAMALFAYSGGVAVAASGNDGRATMDYPGSSAYALTVAAVDRRGRWPKWSSWSRWPSGPDFAAPGVDVPTLSMRGYKKLSGTSIATAIAGGTIALAQFSGLDQARQAAHAASVALPSSRDQTGFGLLDALLLTEKSSRRR